MENELLIIGKKTDSWGVPLDYNLYRSDKAPIYWQESEGKGLMEEFNDYMWGDSLFYEKGKVFCSNFHASKMLVSNDNGNTWTNIKYNLEVTPNSSVRAPIDLDNNAIYVLNQEGVLWKLENQVILLATEGKKTSENNFSFYPNPSSHATTIEVNSEGFIRVFTDKGSAIIERHVTASESIMLPENLKGVFYVQFENKAGVSTQKLIKN